MSARIDLAIVGGGTAGAAVAAAAVRHGLSARLFEAGPLEEAGARWVNGVARWAFTEGGLALPEPPERRGEAGGEPAFHLIAGAGPSRITVRNIDMIDVDMRHLVARLQGLARAGGAQLEGGRKVIGWRAASGFGVLQLDGGEEVEARVIVDASGMAGARLGSQEPLPRDQICVASQRVCRVRDPQRARAWLQAQGASLHEPVCFAGIAGGYSILNIRLMEGAEEVSLLAGSIPGLGHPAGQLVLDRFIEEQGWVGEVRFGGTRAIPLGLPLAELAQGPLVRLGDAGRQVFAAHGSGIGAQLVAAELLGRTLAAGGGPWDFNVAWQRRWGGSLAQSHLFARFSSELTGADLGRMISDGLMTESLIRGAMEQREGPPPLAELPGLARGAWRSRKLMARLLPVGLRMARVHRHYRHFPDDPAGVGAWRAGLERLVR